MKCGREIALGQVFCKECLADMEQYPIAPGTPVPMFNTNPVVAPKRPTSGRKQKKPEEQIAGLKKWILTLSLILLAVIIIFSLITSVLVHRLEEAEENVSQDQNYSSLDTTY
jgi:hypothetical protein